MKSLLESLGLSKDTEGIQVASSLQMQAIDLTPEEGFLLSRIDAASSLRDVFHVSPFPQEQTLTMLKRFVRDGMIVAREKRAPPAAPIKAKEPAKTPARRPKIPVTDLDPELCFAIEDQMARLAKGNLKAEEVLGLTPDADFAACKKAYRDLSKTFHPDRFFRIEAGPYRAWAETLFRRTKEAFDDIKARQRSKKKAADTANSSSSVPSHSKPFKPGESPIMNRIGRGVVLLKEAKQIVGRDPVEALNKLKLAATIDPHNKEVKELLKEVEGRANLRRSISLMEEGKKYEDLLAYDQAQECFEKAVNGDPENAEYRRRLANFFLFRRKEARAALEHARKACDLEPRNQHNFMILGQAAKALKILPEAKLAFERVLQLDKSNLFAKNELRELANLS